MAAFKLSSKTNYHLRARNGCLRQPQKPHLPVNFGIVTATCQLPDVWKQVPVDSMNSICTRQIDFLCKFSCKYNKQLRKIEKKQIGQKRSVCIF